MSDHRRVRRLHLSGARQEHLARATPLVEDALRVASIPLGPPGSVIVVRRLDLGEIRLDQPSQALALRITERVRALTSRAVHVLRPGAEQAPVVWFRGPWEAQALLVMRLLRGPPPREWFWRSVVRQWSPALPAARLIQSLLRPEPFTRPGEPPPALVVAGVVEALARWGGLVEALEVLPEPPRSPGPLPDAPAARAPLPEPWEGALRALVARHGADWVGLPWVLVQAATALWPERVGAPALLQEVAAHRARLRVDDALLIEVTENRFAPEGGGEGRPRVAPAPPPIPEPPAAPARADVAPEQAPSAPTAAPASPSESSAAPGAARAEPRDLASAQPSPAAPPSAPERDEPRPVPPAATPQPAAEHHPMASTGYGGVVTAILLLERLGLGERVLRTPALAACAFGWRVINATLDRLEADPEDPVRAALAPRAEPVPLQAPPFVTPPRWTTLLGEEAPQADPERGQAAEREAWVDALIALGARLAELSLEEWLRAEALLSVDATHLEVLRPASAVQLALRRAALDVNPGWVPWLGRVVTLHYLDDRHYASLKPTA